MGWTILHLDRYASDYAHGAVLMQKDENEECKPIEFMLRHFSESEKNWQTTSKELFTVIQAVKKWDKHLYQRFYAHSHSKNVEYSFKCTKTSSISKCNTRQRFWSTIYQRNWKCNHRLFITRLWLL